MATSEINGKAAGVLCLHAKLLQLCLTLCDPTGCSPPDFSVHGILQARIPEWVAMPSSRGIFPPQGLNPPLLCLLIWQAGSSPPVPPGKPVYICQPCFHLMHLMQVHSRGATVTASQGSFLLPCSSWENTLFLMLRSETVSK